MRMMDTPEMEGLKKIFEPYLTEIYKLVADAPKEAIDAYKEYFRLSEIQRQNEIKSWFE